MNNQLILYVQGKGRKSADEFVKITKGVEEAINDYLLKKKTKIHFCLFPIPKHSDKPYLSRPFFAECSEEY